MLNKFGTYAFLAIFSLILFVPGIQKIPTIDRDEAHFAQASRQMLQTNHFFQVRFQEKTRFQKPPGINWLQAVSVKLFSDANAAKIWPYRVPSVLSALLSVLLLYFFARRFMNQTTALIASALLASTFLLVIESHMAVIDTALLSSVLLMQGALWIIYMAGMKKETTHWIWPLLFWLAMSYGFVLKGVTPLVGCLTVITLCLVDRRMAWLRGLYIFPGLVLFTTLSLAWLFKVNQAEHSNYLLQMLHKDLLPKLQGGHESHGQPPFFHMAILPVTFWPASLFLWQAGVYAFRQRSQPMVRFLLAWIIPTWLFFEFMPTKLPQYVLPTFPAIAVLCALAIGWQDEKTISRRWLHLLQIFWGLLSLGLGVAGLFLAYQFFEKLTVVSTCLFIIVGSLSFIGLYNAWHAKYKQAVVAIMFMVVMAYPVLFYGLIPSLKPLWLSSHVARLVKNYPISRENPLLVVGYNEPSLVFNLDTHLVQFTSLEQAVSQTRAHPKQLILVNEDSFDASNDRQQFKILVRQDGFNYSKGKPVTLLLLQR